SEELHILCVNIHHIIFDGWSNSIFNEELMVLYQSHDSGKGTLLQPVHTQYADFAHWQRGYLQGDVLEEQLAYWVSQLKGIPAVLSLPTDRPRPAVQTTNGRTLSFTIDGEVTNAAKKYASDNQSTLFMLLLGTYQLLLSRYSGQDDIVVGSPIAGRESAQTERMLGYFVNALVFRGQLSGNLTGQQLLQQTREAVVGGFAHQYLPFEALVDAVQPERNLSYPPIAQVGFALQNMPSTNMTLEALSVDSYEITTDTAKYDLILMLHDSPHGDNLVGNIEYNTDLFDQSTIEQFSRHFEYLLGQMVSLPDQALSSYALFPDHQMYLALSLNPEDYEYIVPLTSTQRDLYMHSHVHADTLDNSLGCSFEMRTDIDPDQWAQALQVVTNVHSVLRTDVVPADKPYLDMAYLAVAKTKKVALDYRDLSAMKLSHSEFLNYINAEVYRSFNVSKDALICHYLFKLADEHYVSLLAGHHLSIDGAGGTLHMQQVCQVYQAQSSGETWQPEFVDFTDYVHDQAAVFDLADDLLHWQSKLKDVQPLDFPKPDVTKVEQLCDSVSIGSALWKQFRSACRRHKSTPSLVLKSLYGLLLQQYCRPTNDFVVYEIISGRKKQHNRAIGCYYQQVPVLFQQALMQPSNVLSEYLNHIKQAQKQLGSAQNISVLQQQKLIQHGRIGFLYNYYDFHHIIDFMGQKQRLQHYPPRVPVGQVQLIAKQMSDDLLLECHYHTQDFNSFAAMRRLKSVIEQFVEGVDTIADLSWVTGEENAQLDRWNNTSAIHEPNYSNIIDAIQLQMQNNPDALAVQQGEQCFTYRDIEQQSLSLATRLQRLGITSNQAVAICTSRGADFIVALLATLKAGGYYVPLDPTYPNARLQYIVEDCQAQVLLSQSRLNVLPDYSGIRVDLDKPVKVDVATFSTVATTSNALAYMIYTSGSTGQPKGVGVKHSGIANLLHWYTKTLSIDEADGAIIISALGFDLTQKNLFALLWQGGRLIFPQFDHYDVDDIANTMSKYRPTLLNCAPSAFYPLCELPSQYGALSSLKSICLGGEPIERSKIKDYCTQSSVTVFNSYGPTECTDIAAFYELKSKDLKGGHSIPIGRPNDNVSLLVLNSQLQSVPIGITGELYISGAGVSLGYINDAEKTQKVFIKNPTTGQEMYQTGDLVYYRADGQLVFVGRVDSQVKLRGLRIEIGEIEFAIRGYDAKLHPFVMVVDDVLVAYLVGSFDQALLSESIATFLPDYMVPTRFVSLQEFPLTPNGKIDKKALPTPDLQQLSYVAPSSTLEKQLCQYWSELLAISKVGVEDNFFALGGHSLSATQLISWIRKQYAVELPLADIFQQPTVKRLAENIVQLEAGQTNDIQVRDESMSARAPLSFAQERMWFIQNLIPESTQYNIASAVTIKGGLNVTAIQIAITTISQRHEVLRTRFPDEQGIAVQVIDPEARVTVEQFDIGCYDIERQSDEVRLRIQQDQNTVFNLAEGPLFKCTVLQLTDNHHVLMLTIHHIIADGWSSQVMLKELMAVYLAEQESRAVRLPHLSVQYADYAIWQRDYEQSEKYGADLGYWQSQLQGVDPLVLPVDYTRPSVQTFAGAHLQFSIPALTMQGLKRLANDSGATEFMVLMTVYHVLLSRLSGQQDFAVGVPTAGRSQAEIEPLIGAFINSLAIRNALLPEMPFSSALEQVKKTVLSAFLHDKISFEKIVEAVSEGRDLTHAPIYQTFFTLQNLANDSLVIEGLEIEPFEMVSTTAKFDLSLVTWFADDGCLECVFEYNTDLFSADSIARFGQYFKHILEQVVVDESLEIGRLTLLSESDRTTILHDWNQAHSHSSSNQNDSIVSRFQQSAQQFPERIALQQQQRSMNYQQVDVMSNQLAYYLIEQGIGVESIVGVYIHRSMMMLVCQLAIMKSGAAYLPIDPAYPEDRVNYMLNDSGAQFVFTETALTMQDVEGVVRFDVDNDLTVIEPFSQEALCVATSLNDLAYVIYTSGSTGKPKGVQIEQRSLSHFLAWAIREFAITEADKVSQVAGVAFDAAIIDSWPFLAQGACVCLVNDIDRMDPERMQQWLLEHGVTVSFLPTSLTERVLDLDWPAQTKLRYVLTGGDLLHRYPKEGLPFALYNLYGPTEVTILVTAGEVPCRTENRLPSIGKPIDNAEIYILDSNMQPQPMGVAGDLYLTGAGLFRGYINQPELTQAVLIDNPIAGSQYDKLYKTGDLARFRGDGQVEFMGRSDQQVKLRGYRIEL
ncbi:MAG: amino acid adenylation domain-containing protein, partial [Methylococcales bacterium]|nr:amino acid adenylation domain-containing protein [Methylococcales bacterium]